MAAASPPCCKPSPAYVIWAGTTGGKEALSRRPSSMHKTEYAKTCFLALPQDDHERMAAELHYNTAAAKYSADRLLRETTHCRRVRYQRAWVDHAEKAANLATALLRHAADARAALTV